MMKKFVPGLAALGLFMARHLMETYQLPICMINGAVGGTIIESHQRNPANPTNSGTIYGRLLSRVQQAHLLCGANGLAALTFCNVPIAAARRLE